MVDPESAPHSDFGRHLAPPDSKRSALAEDCLKAVIGATAFEKQDPKGTKEILNKYLKNVPDDLLDETYQQYVVASIRSILTSRSRGSRLCSISSS